MKDVIPTRATELVTTCEPPKYKKAEKQVKYFCFVSEAKIRLDLST